MGPQNSPFLRDQDSYGGRFFKHFFCCRDMICNIQPLLKFVGTSGWE